MLPTSDFNLSELDAADEAELVIRHPKTGEPTTWIWTFYGPGHPATVALAERASREALRNVAARRQAQVNGKKWKEDSQSPDELRAENVANIVARTKTFTPVNLGSGPVEFSADAAAKLLLDRRKGFVLAQIVEFLVAEENFIQPSARA